MRRLTRLGGGRSLKPARRTVLFAALAMAAVTLAVVGVLRWDWGQFVVETAEAVNKKYGVSIPLAVALFGIGELLFIGSVAMMLKEAGTKVTWHNIHAFKLKDLNLGSRRMTAWLWVNRASWVVPWVIVILLSLGKVPWWATAAALTEVGVTLALGIVLTLGLKLPWWNNTAEEET